MLDFLFDLFSDAAEDVDVEDLPCDEYDGVEGGVFSGDSEDLEELSEGGMLDGTEHIDADDIVRDIAARNDFLEQCGFDSVPEGYEVHHIIPLSEGGMDDPDNMVLALFN